MAEPSDLHRLRDQMRRFTEERDWQRFHDPKSLVLALVGEVGELAEQVQWLPAEDVVVRAKQEPQRTALADELADVLLYLVRLCDVLDIDLGEAALAKMLKNRHKHPTTP